MYSRRQVTDHTTVMNKDLYDNLQDGIDEVNSKLAMLETSIDWKETVETFADIATTYPNPEDGWTVNVKDTNYTYRYSGTEWVAISANAIPKATDSVDGLLSKEGYKKLNGIDDGANKTTVDSALSSTSTNPVQNKVVNSALGTKPTLEKWTCPVKVGEWSRVCRLDEFQTGIFSVSFLQNFQTFTYTYLVTFTYRNASIIQIGNSGVKDNGDIKLRVTLHDSTNPVIFYIEVLNSYGYNGASEVNAYLSYEIIDNIKLNKKLNKYTTYTPTLKEPIIAVSIDSKYDGIVSPKFYGDLVGNADNASYADKAGSATKATYADNADNADYATSAGSASSATKATNDSKGNNIAKTYVPFSDTGAIAVGTGLTRGGYEEATVSSITVTGVVVSGDVMYDGEYWYVECSCDYNSDLISYLGQEYSTFTSNNSTVQNYSGYSSFAYVSPNAPNTLLFHFSTPEMASDFSGLDITCTITLDVGSDTKVIVPYQVLLGNYNIPYRTTSKTTATLLQIGNGVSGKTSNALRLTYGSTMYLGSGGNYNSSGADYAELEEWADGNPNDEDRRGYFVTRYEEDPKKIRFAKVGDRVLGVVSSNPCIIGNSEEEWHGKYLKDKFGCIMYKFVFDDKGTIIGKEPILSPEFDPTLEYIPRSERKEWDNVCWIGNVPVIDDGTCVVGGFCKIVDGGTVTYAKEDEENTYRVTNRLADDVVEIDYSYEN